MENERHSLEKALRQLIDKDLVTVKWLESPALSELHHCLMDGEYHVFHFICHGGFDRKTQEGVLILEDEKRAGCEYVGCWRASAASTL